MTGEDLEEIRDEVVSVEASATLHPDLGARPAAELLEGGASRASEVVGVEMAQDHSRGLELLVTGQPTRDTP